MAEQNGRKIFIFDTTLRDGEQSPGASLNAAEKLEIARQLARLNVDIIEAGNPVSSLEDFVAVQAIAKEVGNLPDASVICALARCVDKDIDRAAEAVQSAKKPMLHVYIGVSNVHMNGQLRKTSEQVLEMAVRSVERATKRCYEVQFSPMDSGRAFIEDGPKFLYEIIRAAIAAGATVINIPETVGYAFPWEFEEMIKALQSEIPELRPDGGIRLSVHCHDDRGTATSLSLASVKAGATQIEGCVNGVGERAGNTAIEEVIMAIFYRGDALGNVYTDINTREIMNTSRLVSRLMGFPVPPNKAIVGANAFAHSSGVHQDGILKERTTFEIMNPEDVGVLKSEIVLTARSGRHALQHRLQELGYEVIGEQLDAIYERFIEVADAKKEVWDEDLRAIMEDTVPTVPQMFSLGYFYSRSGTDEVPLASIGLQRAGEIALTYETASGDGPVDAVYKAIDKITGVKVELADYSIHGVTKGKDAMGGVTVRVQANGMVVIGRGVSTDIIEASAKAYLNAINKMLYEKEANAARWRWHMKAEK